MIVDGDGDGDGGVLGVERHRLVSMATILSSSADSAPVALGLDEVQHFERVDQLQS